MLRLDHIGIATNDASALAQVLKLVTGGRPGTAEDIAHQGVRVQFYPSRVEALEAMQPDSALGRHLDRRGPGLHHVAFTVPDLDAHLARLRSAGLEPVAPPSVGAGGKRICFLPPKETGHVLIELCEHSKRVPIVCVDCPSLEAALLNTGECIRGSVPDAHVVLSGSGKVAPEACHSLTVHNASDISGVDGRPYPVLISYTDEYTDDAIALQRRARGARLVVLPAAAQLEVLPDLLTAFWRNV